MHVDSEGWSGDGAFTQSVVELLRTIDRVVAMKVEDAPATRSEADYNFIANEIFVTFATAERTEPDQEARHHPWHEARDREGDDAR